MSGEFERFVGLRYLRSKPFQTVMSTVGIVLGIWLVIVVISGFRGFQQTIRDRLLGSEPHLTVLKRGLFDDYEAFLQTVEEIPHVVAAAPVVMSDALLQNRQDKRRRYGARIYGVDPERAPRVTNLADYMGGRIVFDDPDILRIGKSKLPEGDTVKGGIILGRQLARRLNVNVGDPIVVFSNFREGPRGEVIPIVRNFVVVGTYTSGLYEIDASVAYISLEDAQEIFDLRGAVTQVEIRTTSLEDADLVKAQILQRYGLEYFPQTWKEIRGAFFVYLELEERLSFAVLAISVVVAAFSISITLVMLVREKTREIGILKAMGASNRSILRIFMLHGTTIGVVGAILGTTIGIATCWVLEHWLRIPLPGDVYQVDQVHMDVSPVYVGLINGLTVLVCWLATLYPAYRAAMLRPVEALRYE